jgi:hypothetical protein
MCREYDLTTPFCCFILQQANFKNLIMMKKSITLILLALLCYWKLEGQVLYPSVIGAFGGEFKNNSYHLTFTAGEPFFTTVSSNDVILTQGFNQTLVVTTQNTTDISILEGYELKAYPNPTSEYLILGMKSPHSDELLIELFDMQGRKLFWQATNEKEQKIDFKPYANGSFILRISKSDVPLKSFIIQKIK